MPTRKLFIYLSDKLARDQLVFDVRIAVNETTPLLSQLLWSHLYRASLLDKLL